MGGADARSYHFQYAPSPSRRTAIMLIARAVRYRRAFMCLMTSLSWLPDHPEARNRTVIGWHEPEGERLDVCWSKP